MTENHGAPPFNGSDRNQAPAPAAGFRGRIVGQPQASIHQQAVPLRGGFPSVKISDVRHGLMTVDDMKEELTEYALFRFEKYTAQSRYDDEGRLRLPTWDQAIISQVQSMSTEEIRRRVQYLNRRTRAPTEKLKTLSPVLQRQIDKTIEELKLQNPDPINYRWVLVQLDHQLAEINSPYVSVAARNRRQSRRHHGVPRRQPHRDTNGDNPRSFQRISLTTYFKRVPKAEADIPALYEAKKRMRFSQNNHVAHPYPQPQLQPQPQSHPHHGPDYRIPLPGQGSVDTRLPLGSNSNRPQPVPPPPNGLAPGLEPGPGIGGPMNNAVVGGGTKVSPANIKHAKIESESDHSDYLSSDRSFDSQTTPDTSYSSKSLNRGRTLKRVHNSDHGSARSLGRKHDRDGPREYHRKHKDYFDDGHGVRMPPKSRRPSTGKTSSVDIDRAIGDAYLAGVLRERKERTKREARYSTSNPRILLGARLTTPPYGGRHIPTSDRQRDTDDGISRFKDLSISDGDDYDAVLPRVDGRRRREFEHLMQEGSILEEDPFDRERSSNLRHGGRRYEESYVTDDSDSDDSLPRTRRSRFHY
ncbi:uncharacterized protein F4812DRAFT_133799 [Daldinia caldariorum]|uniref:uncharacterized protein n=1 Tax=Daldinia caldariorum TaxID=326644 RepID=UPI00200818A4|nr:uncharacterized protein F4812DRAFT_133799 [Daldinia caldariorum]KAI1465142.1 hypothetical protein F4812DRAFT_133799 [Daldinia caldariorum]